MHSKIAVNPYHVSSQSFFINLQRNPNMSTIMISNQRTNSGISLSSFFEQKYSPKTTMTIIPIICIIHQSHVDGNPSYIEQTMMCIIKRVTEKSRHFLDFSTIIASIIDLSADEGKNFHYRTCSKMITITSIDTHPIILEKSIAALSIHPEAVQMSKYFAVKIRSIVMEVANKT